MKISYNWLKTYLDVEYEPRALADVLTMLGLEVGKVEKIGGAFNDLEGVIVGEVLQASQHPNADRLKVCLVNVGAEEPLHIVCGAPNVAAGQKVPLATVGTTLLPFGSDSPFKIKKQKVRGEVSQGMICAEDELGLGTEHDGIMVLDESAEVGAPALPYLNVSIDYALEIDLTPNRIDGASHYGAARDIAAYLRTQPKLPPISVQADAGKPNPISVTIEDPERCKRYVSIYLEGIRVAPSPEWMQKRLTTIGLRPINNIVDITNYVMFELGQPLHAFDADQLKGGQIIVKTLAEDTPFETLDEVERTIKAGQDLMICDGERGLCIGGVMGGLNSGVTEETKNVFLEAAYFDPGTVRRTSKRLGLQSDSSFRFERGVDPYMTPTAALRAASLIVEIAGGTASAMSDVKLSDFPYFPVSLSIAKTQRIIGKEISREEIIDILEALEVRVSGEGDLLSLEVPPYRVDVQRDIDVIEDILRVYGYNNIDIPQALNASLSDKAYQDAFRLKEKYANTLAAQGLHEILNNSLVHKNLGDEQAVALVNPLGEELGIMRQSLLPGMLESMRYNQNRQQEDLAFYEFGKTYRKKGSGYEEKEWLAIGISGHSSPPHWRGPQAAVSLTTLGREVERLQRTFGFSGKLREASHPDFAYCLELVHNGKVVLTYGKVHSELSEANELRNEVYYLIANWALLVEIHFEQQISYQAIPLYPSMRRDLSLLIDQQASFGEIHALVPKANPKLIRSVDLRDVYQGKGIPEDKKSYLISIELRDDQKTLADKAADKVMQRVESMLTQELGAEVRR
ncbi:MAG: phenylalanine--tRNA ligase subunit beta [Bacteroidota bacterium]